MAGDGSTRNVSIVEPSPQRREYTMRSREEDGGSNFLGGNKTIRACPVRRVQLEKTRVVTCPQWWGTEQRSPRRDGGTSATSTATPKSSDATTGSPVRRAPLSSPMGASSVVDELSDGAVTWTITGGASATMGGGTATSTSATGRAPLTSASALTPRTRNSPTRASEGSPRARETSSISGAAREAALVPSTSGWATTATSVA